MTALAGGASAEIQPVPDEVVTQREEGHPIRCHRWPSHRALAEAPAMPGIDADAIDYMHWAKNIAGLADTTLRVRWDVLSRLASYSDRPLRTLEPGHLLAFERVAIAGRAAETRRAYACHIRAFYRWALRAGLIDHDPSTVLTIPRVPRHLPRPISEDDLTRALADARPKMRLILILGAYAGLRCVEIAGLDWTDLRYSSGESCLHVRHAKGGQERVVDIGETVITALRAYGIRRRGPMFVGADGRKMNPHSISASGNRYLHEHGIDATMHRLRHRYGTVGYQLSKDLRMLQEQMGHRSPNSTAIYTRASAEAAAAMVSAMDALAAAPVLRLTPDPGPPVPTELTATA